MKAYPRSSFIDVLSKFDAAKDIEKALLFLQVDAATSVFYVYFCNPVILLVLRSYILNSDEHRPLLSELYSIADKNKKDLFKAVGIVSD